MANNVAFVVNRSVDFLHPKMREAVLRLSKAVAHPFRDQPSGREYSFQMYEGFRTVQRQAHLISVGTTKAGPWQSAHQYGLAVDFVPIHAGRWTWDGVPTDAWEWMRSEARSLGLRTPIAWDLPHLEHPDWPRVAAILA